MARAMIGMLLAASVMTPTLATAQDGDGRWHGHHGERAAQAGPRPQQAAPGQRPGGETAMQQQPGGQPRGAWRGQQRNGQPWTGARAGELPPQGGRGGQPGDGARAGLGFGPGRAEGFAGREGRPGYAPPAGYAGRGGDGRSGGDAGRRGYAPQGGDWQRGYADRRDDARDRAAFADRSAWNRGWRTDDRYDWNRYRAGNEARFHLPRYASPYGYGYGYRRFGIGVRLDEFLFGPDYWIEDPYDYRLPPVDGPYRWVRYYDDALLVDLRSGIVVDTVYGIFW